MDNINTNFEKERLEDIYFDLLDLKDRLGLIVEELDEIRPTLIKSLANFHEEK